MNALTRPVTTKFDVPLFEKLGKVARRDRLSVSDCVRLAALDYVDRHRKPPWSEIATADEGAR